MKYEQLYFAPDMVIVARLSGATGGMLYGAIGAEIKGELSYRESSLDDIIKADKNSYTIPNSEITKVELKKSWGTYNLYITASKKKHKWYVLGLHINPNLLTPPERKRFDEERSRSLEGLLQWGENKILRPTFPENKLSIKLRR